MTDYEKAVALWQRKNIKTDAELAEAINGHSIAFAYHSGKIENDLVTYNDTREIFEHDGVVSYTGDLRTLFEISNAKDANEFLLLHDHPPVIIHEEDRKEYYSALEAWDERQELKPLEEFLKGQTAKTWQKQIERNRSIL